MITSPTRPGDIFASTIRKITGSSPCPRAGRVQVAANEYPAAGGAAGNLNEIVSFNAIKVLAP